MVPNLPAVPASQGQGGGWGLVQASAPLGLPPRPLRKKEGLGISHGWTA